MRLLERAGDFQRRVVEITQGAIRGELEHRVRIEPGEGRQLPDLPLGALALAGVARHDEDVLRLAVPPEYAGDRRLERQPASVGVLEAQLDVAPLAQEHGLLEGLAQHLGVVRVQKRGAGGAGHLLRLAPQDAPEGGACIERAKFQVHQADQVARMFGDQAVLLLGVAQGNFGVGAIAFGPLFPKGVSNRRRQPAQAGLEDVVVRPLLNAAHRDFLRMRSGDEDERHLRLAFLEQLQRLDGAEFRQRVVGQDRVRLETVQLAEELIARLHPARVAAHSAAFQLVFDQFRVGKRVLDQENVQGRIHRE